ncbi:RodZ domain-containing protein [Spongorhabdus nitratireducens]
MTNETTDAPEQEVLPLEPGLMLRQKRESRNLSLSEVAERLHITVQYVAALENDAYDELPGDTFVRGYLRSYARLLGLNPDEVIDAANNLLPEQAEDQGRRLDMSGEPVIAARKRPGIGALLTGTIALALAVGGVAWWQQQQKADAIVDSAPAVSAPAVVEKAVVEAAPAGDATEIPLTEGDNSLEYSAPDEDGAQDPATLAEPLDIDDVSFATVEDEDTGLTQNELQSEPVSEQVKVTKISSAAPDASQQKQKAKPVEASEVPKDVTTVTKKSAAVIKTPASGRLAMEFSADCWVKITDLKGKVLYMDVQKAGSKLDLNDLGAVKLILGNVHGVSELRFNDKLVALDTSDGRGNVARLTLGLNQG